jgi:hypothetical protein
MGLKQYKMELKDTKYLLNLKTMSPNLFELVCQEFRNFPTKFYSHKICTKRTGL